MQLSRFRLAFDVLVLVFFAYIFWASTEFRSLAGYFPGTVSGTALALGLVNLGVDIVRFRRMGTAIGDQGFATAIVDEQHGQQSREALQRMARYVAWIIGFVVLIGVIGMVPATLVFLLGFFWFDARTSKRFAILGAVIGTALLMLGTEVLSLRWPPSLLQIL